MFGSNVLEVTIGLVFIYSLLSLLCSTINEQVIARLFAMRSKTLEDGIKTMLNDPKGYGAAKDFYNNPLIKGLAKQGVFDKVIRRYSKPSYISSSIFALVIKDIVATDPDVIPPALKILLDQANGDVQQELAIVEKWFDETMDRVSGWYKRKVQLIIFAMGLAIVVYLNFDTFSILSTLSNNKAQIQDLIGWQISSLPAGSSGWILKIVGLLATTFAVSLGAPFCFDLLNKFMSFRSSGPPPQRSSGAPGSTGSTRLSIADQEPKQIYELDLHQARSWSNSSTIAATLGFLLIIGGVITIFAANTIIGLAISVTGGITEIVAILALQQAREAYKQVDSTRQKLLESYAIKQDLLMGDDALKEKIFEHALRSADKEYGVSAS